MLVSLEAPTVPWLRKESALKQKKSPNGKDRQEAPMYRHERPCDLHWMVVGVF